MGKRINYSRLLFLLSLLVVVIIIVTAGRLQTRIHIQASEQAFEAEDGVQQQTTIQNDAQASNGKYVVFPLFTISPSPTLQPGTWIDVGTHPQASSMATAVGKMIITLESWRGKIYAGYGDFTENLGPTWITSYDPTTRTFTDLYSSSTDAIWNYRPLLSQLYAPATDPIDVTDFAVGSDERSFEDDDWGGSTHIFDANTLMGSDIWMTGSTGYDATAWRSLDGGLSWGMVQSSKSVSGTVERYYFAGVYKGKLYLQSRIDSTSKVFDGTSWSTGPSLGGSWWKPQEFAGKMVALTAYAGYSTSNLAVFDGSKVSYPVTSVYNYTIFGNTLYVLTSTGIIKKSTDLVSWTTVSTAPTTARSLTVLNNNLFIGTNDGHLFMFSTALSTLPTVLLTPLQNVASEGEDASYVLSRNGPLIDSLTVTLLYSGTATTGGDYSPTPTITFAPGQSQIRFSLPITKDGLSEGLESLTISIAPTATYLPSSPASSTVLLSDVPTIWIQSTQEVNEGGTANITLHRSGDSSQPLLVGLATSGTATRETDYTLITSASFAAGQSTLSLPLASVDDVTEEADETVTVSLNKSSLYTLKRPNKVTINIEDNDVSPSQNLIQNPSFETGTATADYWGISGTNWDKTVSHTGTASLKVIGPAKFSYIQQGATLTPGKTYIISAYVKTQRAYGRGGGFRMVETAATTDIRESPWVNGDTNWKRISMSYLPKADYTGGRLDLTYRLNTGDTVWFDDIAIREVQ